MSGKRESLHIPLPPAITGEKTHFSLKGKPFAAVLTVTTEHGTVIEVPIAPHGMVTIFCGADRSTMEVEIVVPDSELIDARIDRVGPPSKAGRKGNKR